MTAPVRVVSPAEGEWVLGGRHQVKITGPASDGRFAFWTTPSTFGDGPPLHIHEREDEVFFVLEGAYDILVDGRRIHARPGDCVALPPHLPHRYCGARRHATSWALQMVVPAGLEDYLRLIGDADASTPQGMDLRHRVGTGFGLSFPEPAEPFHQPQASASPPWRGGGQRPPSIAPGRGRVTCRLDGDGAAVVHDVEIGAGARWTAPPSAAGGALFICAGAASIRRRDGDVRCVPGATVYVPPRQECLVVATDATRLVHFAALEGRAPVR